MNGPRFIRNPDPVKPTERHAVTARKPGETLEAWIGRDMAQRLKAEKAPPCEPAPMTAPTPQPPPPAPPLPRYATSRERIMARLAQGPASIKQLSQDCFLSRQAITRQMMRLRVIGLVTGTPDGRQLVYTAVQP